jgi:branched-chain amino acid transport system substrate-binding protein
MRELAKRSTLILSAFLINIFLQREIYAQSKMATIAERTHQDLLIGVNADLSLGGASAGQAIVRGVQLAVEEINANGGVLGRQLKFEVKDHAGIVLRGKENLRELNQSENLIGVIGGIHSNVILSELQFIHEHQIPYLIPWAAADDLVDNGYRPNFVFRLGGRDQWVSEFLVSEAVKRGKKIALMLETTVWGRSNLKSLTRAMAARGLHPVAVEWIDRADTDANIQIAALQKRTPDVVILALNAPEGALVVNTMAARGTKFSVLSHWGIASNDFFSAAADALQKISVEFFQPFSFFNFKNTRRSFVISKIIASEPSHSIAKVNAAVGLVHAYDLTRMLARAVQKSKSTDRKKIRLKLESLGAFEGAACPLSPPFTAHRHEAINIKCFILAEFSKTGELRPTRRDMRQ